MDRNVIHGSDSSWTFFALIFLLLLVTCCSSPQDHSLPPSVPSERLFTIVSSLESGIDFTNTLEETLESNYYQYMYTYLGGGVAAADFNNDGWVDLFFTSNTYDNKLYINRGDLKFEDYTAKAGLEQRPGFDTGVTVADVNNDGYTDIYVGRGGWQDENNKFANMLFINNGDLTFTEMAEPYGLADGNRTINATFFDYDKDNDLDVYISNTPDITSRTQVVDLSAVQKDPKTISLKGSDRLYNNDGIGHFTDVSEQAGILPDIGFGLNPQVGDLNNDGWLDVYVCNDFNVPDFAYINNGDGTFTEGRNELFKHMSFNSMGGDMADVNNDGLLDLMTLDMNPEDYVRSKTTMAMTSIDQFELMVSQDYHYQYMHNMLQINNGNGSFSEIANMAGVANTDWSWSMISADFDLDGFNDIYVTNGVYRDVIDRDKNNEILQILRTNQRKPTAEDFLTFAKMLPQQKLTNYFFKNNGDLTFEDTSLKWVDSTTTFSNGAVYADLDNDGDLEVVVNNINEGAMVLKNHAVEQGLGNYLQFEFTGPEKNPFGVGVIVKVYTGSGPLLTRQLINTRGFLSAVSNRLHVGIGQNEVPRIEVHWPDGKVQVLANVASNQILHLNYSEAEPVEELTTVEASSTIFTKINTDVKHQDLYNNDYERQILLPHKLSHTGPALAVADVNLDGHEDVFLGGGHWQSAQLLLGQKNGSLRPQPLAALESDSLYEDVGACFFDADNDGDMDLYVVSGSYEFYRTPQLLQDRLYLNEGSGKFTKAVNKLPEMQSAGSVVKAMDYDLDGDMDLFVGGRVIPDRYPYPPNSYLLVNQNGSFQNATAELAPELVNIGMVTDACWADINDDNRPDLVIAGEWMGIEVFINHESGFEKSDHHTVLSMATGWWNKLLIEDVDNDGDKDIIAGNLGLNYKFHASQDQPFHVYAHDFDYDGIEDIMLAKYYNQRQVPVRGKVCTAQQMPHLTRKIPTFNEFAQLDLEGIVGPGLGSALHYQAVEFRSGIFYNQGDGNYSFSPFSLAVQQSPINSTIYQDFDGDGIGDLILAGNNYHSEVETTRADAGIGSFLKGNGDGTFEHISHLQSGFFAEKDVRNLALVHTNGGLLLFVANNNSLHDLFKVILN